MNVQLDGTEPQVERGSQEEGPWRTAPGPLEHLCCDLEEEPQSLQEKGKSLEGVCVCVWVWVAGRGEHSTKSSLLIYVENRVKIPKLPWTEHHNQYQD